MAHRVVYILAVSISGLSTAYRGLYKQRLAEALCYDV